MKETLLTNCEKSFVLSAIANSKRLDGRKVDECRDLKIFYGSEYGSCQVSLGETKVLAQVSCEVQQPATTRPNEGVLNVYVEFSPMGASNFEVGRPTELAVQVNRLLEKCLKDSHCVDLEALCITFEEKVWALRVDINILNHEGSLIDAASVAALAALAHFRRPDITMTGEQTTIHDASERDPIPLTLHHYPICLTYALYNGGKHFAADPSYIEERVSEAQVVYGVNSYRELCSLHLGGNALSNSDILIRCASKAAIRAAFIVLQIKAELAKDQLSREKEKEVGFVKCINKKSIFSQQQAQICISLSTLGLRNAAKNLSCKREVSPTQDDAALIDDDEEDGNADFESSSGADVRNLGNRSAELADERMEIEIPSSDNEECDLSDLEVITEVEPGPPKKKVIQDIVDLSDGSEEEGTVTLRPAEMNQGKNPVRKREKNKGKRRGGKS